MLVPKRKPIRDRKYLDSLRDAPCIITGYLGCELHAVDPVHIGTRGKGYKSSDDETLPILHSIHLEMHRRGEMTVLRELLPDDVLRDALRALARERYREWKQNDH